MKFLDYEASHITPQLTLIKKFNELLKFLRSSDLDSFYLHDIYFLGSAHQTLGKGYLFSPKKEYSSVAELCEDCIKFGFSFIYEMNSLYPTFSSGNYILKGASFYNGKYYIGNSSNVTEITDFSDTLAEI